MTTIKEIAHRAGVSIGTVDRVLHQRGRVAPETALLVRKIADELNYTPNSVGQGLALRKKKIKLSFFYVDTVRHPFFEDVLVAAKQKSNELSQYGVEVTFFKYNYDESPVDFSNLQADGIALPGSMDTFYIRQLLNWAAERQIPVVCYNIPITGQDCLAYVGCDYVQAGKIAAGLCSLISNGVGKIGILSEDDGKVPSFRHRVLGFQRELAEHYPGMEIAGVYNSMESIEDAAYQMLWEHPDLDIVYLINPGNYNACKIIHDAAKNPGIRIITNDLTNQQREMVQNHIISATICQEPERQGSQPLEILFQYLAHQKIPQTKNQFTTLSIHIRQNI